MPHFQNATLIFWAYLAVISLVAACVTAGDKRKARRGRWRVPEATLLLLATFGGAAAELLTMLIIRHKTRRVKFMLGLPLILAAQIALIILLTR